MGYLRSLKCKLSVHVNKTYGTTRMVTLYLYSLLTSGNFPLSRALPTLCFLSSAPSVTRPFWSLPLSHAFFGPLPLRSSVFHRVRRRQQCLQDYGLQLAIYAAHAKKVCGVLFSSLVHVTKQPRAHLFYNSCTGRPVSLSPIFGCN